MTFRRPQSYDGSERGPSTRSIHHGVLLRDEPLRESLLLVPTRRHRLTTFACTLTLEEWRAAS